MRIDKITLENFRNYARAEAVFSPGINVISGENAQGKTNLLEAVFLLSGGKSFRTRYDRDMISFDSDAAEVLATVDAAGRSQTIKMSLKRGQKKRIFCNGVRKTASELSGTVSAVLFCPDDLDIIKDGAGARRRLMDTAISQLRPGYAALLSDFSRLYDNKTRILRDWREKPSLLDALDEFSEGLCRISAQLIRYRSAFSRRLEEDAVPIHRDFSGGRETLSIKYSTVSTVTDTTAPASAIADEIREHQKSHRQAELDSGLCLTGAHKDDLEISINGVFARSFASQGQMRTAALSLKLAEREIFLEDTGEHPVLLLDDVLSELDPGRQEFVLNLIGGGQTLITCCEDEQIVRRTGGRVIFIKNGTVSEGS